ncbi:hypothetical protein ACQEU8_19430 [Streptomyces sp. CA-250714]|uniref:hypothetical protein n=1 Tax=Streptomyces sp. CA-250714 TaxID=3240060 RepID=UPI003D91A032
MEIVAFDSYGLPALRGRGPFQFLIKGVSGATPDSGVLVYGHHRAGMWVDDQTLELVYRDGVTHPIEGACAWSRP